MKNNKSTKITIIYALASLMLVNASLTYCAANNDEKFSEQRKTPRANQEIVSADGATVLVTRPIASLQELSARRIIISELEAGNFSEAAKEMITKTKEKMSFEQRIIDKRFKEFIYTKANFDNRINDKKISIKIQKLIQKGVTIDCEIDATHYPETNNGFDENDRNFIGTALAWASYSGYFQTVKILLAANADPNISFCNSAFDESTPLANASLQGDFKIAKLLLAANADPNVFIYHGDSKKTPLILAIPQGHHHIIKILLAAKANPNAVINGNYFGRNKITPLMVAAEDAYNNIIIEQLLYARADITAVDDRGATALDLAKKNRHSCAAEVTKLLMDRQQEELTSQQEVDEEIERINASEIDEICYLLEQEDIHKRGRSDSGSDSGAPAPKKPRLTFSEDIE